MVNIYSISWMEDGDRLYKAFYNIDERSNYREGLINRGIDIYSIIEKNNKIQAR